MIGSWEGYYLSGCAPYEHLFEPYILKINHDYCEPSVEERAVPRVLLNVYHAAPWNRFINCLRIGFYRTSVEVDGVEFMFSEDRGMAGIIMATPGLCVHHKGLRRKKTISVGHSWFDADPQQVKEVAAFVGLAGSFGRKKMNTYDFRTRNSNHFCAHFIRSLTVNDDFQIPAWIKRGEAIERFFNKEVVGAVDRARRSAQQQPPPTIQTVRIEVNG